MIDLRSRGAYILNRLWVGLTGKFMRMRKLLLTGVLGVVTPMLLGVAECRAAAGVVLADVEAAVIREDYARGLELAGEWLKDPGARAEIPRVRYLQALSLLRLGQYARAREIFTDLKGESLPAELSDKVAATYIDTLYMQGFYEKALKEALQLIDRRRSSDMISLFYLKAARANLKLARWARAGEILNRIIAEYPDSFESQVARSLLEEQQYFTVQVGAFTEKERAQRLTEEINRRGEYAFMVETRGLDGRKFYRVRVGRLSALKDARQLESRLAGLGYPALIYP